MNVYPRECPNPDCDWLNTPRWDAWPEIDCYSCGAETRPSLAHGVKVVPDTFSTPLVDDNMTKQRQIFHSRSEHKRALERHGVTIKDRHIGTPGSDKSPQTVRWI